MTAHNVITPAAPAPDYSAIKTKQNAAWSSGNYAVVGTTLQIVGESLAEAMDIAPGSRVIDVAAGNGNATLAFARRWNDVTSTDYVQTLLDAGRTRAEAEGHDVRFQIADAEALPFEDGAFDAAVSTFGVMFAPNEEAAAAEMIRVCRSGGRIGMANWTQSGFVGQLFKTIGAHVSPPAGVKSPAIWGDEAWIDATFGPLARTIKVTRRDFVFRYRSPAHFVDVFRAFYGPVHKAFGALDADGQAALEADILDLIDRFNTASDGTMAGSSEYLEVTVVKA